MAQGFGQPRYWLEIIFPDGSEEWERFTGSKKQAYKTAADRLIDRAAELVLVLDGSVKEGAIPQTDQILADFQRDPVEGAKLMQVVRVDDVA